MHRQRTSRSPLAAQRQAPCTVRMGKYGKKASRKVGRVLPEMKAGTLRSGSGKSLRSRQQAIAIGLSAVRADGARVPLPHK